MSDHEAGTDTCEEYCQDWSGTGRDDSESDDSDDGIEDPIMMDYLSKLDSEVPKEEDDINRPLDIDQNVLSNLLQSYSEELGHGPVSSLFQSMRVNPGRKDTINTS